MKQGNQPSFLPLPPHPIGCINSSRSQHWPATHNLPTSASGEVDLLCVVAVCCFSLFVFFLFLLEAWVCKLYFTYWKPPLATFNLSPVFLLLERHNELTWLLQAYKFSTLESENSRFQPCLKIDMERKGCPKSWVVDHLPSIQDALGSNPSTIHRHSKKDNKKLK